MNAHAGMPFCGRFQFAIPATQPVFGRCWPRATALSGRGSFAFIVYGHAQPRLGKCSDSRPFCICAKSTKIFAERERTSISVSMEAFVCYAQKLKKRRSSYEKQQSFFIGSCADFLCCLW